MFDIHHWYNLISRRSTTSHIFCWLLHLVVSCTQQIQDGTLNQAKGCIICSSLQQDTILSSSGVFRVTGTTEYGILEYLCIGTMGLEEGSNNSGNMVWKCWHSVPGSPWREQLQRPLLFERHHASPPWLKESVCLTASACLAQTTGPKMLDTERRLRKSNIKDRIKVNIIRHTYPNNIFKNYALEFFQHTQTSSKVRSGNSLVWFNFARFGAQQTAASGKFQADAVLKRCHILTRNEPLNTNKIRLPRLSREEEVKETTEFCNRWGQNN